MTGRILALLFLTLCVVPFSILAQSGATGAITGVVVDVKGAPVSSAQIDLTIAGSSAVTRTVFSDADGNFIVPSLPVGAYDLAVKAAGFSTSKYNSVDARLSETTRLNPSLGAPVAAKTEATAGTAHAEDVVMIATPPVVLVETGNPATGRTVTGKVKVEVVITAGGSVKAALLTGGNPVFEKSAADAVKQGRFEPAQTETKAAIVLEFEEW